MRPATASAAAEVHQNMAVGLQPGDYPPRADGDVRLPRDRGGRRPTAGAVIARARVRQRQRIRRSLPDVGEFAHTQFITAMLTEPASPRP
jgi:hypothetical protein